MEKFIKHVGTGVPLRRSNVDTDQIIPAVYLKRVTRSGFEDGLFAAWRARGSGAKLRREAPVNQSPCEEACRGHLGCAAPPVAAPREPHLR